MSGMQKEMREQSVWKESESSWFSLPLMPLLLTCALACHSKWRGCTQSITFFLGSHVCLLFSELVYVRNSEEKN